MIHLHLVPILGSLIGVVGGVGLCKLYDIWKDKKDWDLFEDQFAKEFKEIKKSKVMENKIEAMVKKMTESLDDTLREKIDKNKNECKNDLIIKKDEESC